LGGVEEDGGLDGWEEMERDEGMEEWKNGGMEEWRDGGMEG
jgi:hypothetical protein